MKNIDVSKLDKNMEIKEVIEAGCWYSPLESPFRMSGFAWQDEIKNYRRMPENPTEKLSEAVDSLAWASTGGQIRFRTNARDVSVRVKLRGVPNMHHMPATGQCGFDCYIGESGSMKYHSTTNFGHNVDEYSFDFMLNVDAEWRTLTLNMPLYMGVEKVEIGLTADAELEPVKPYEFPGKFLFYGTSITQGGCANRPGMVFTNILSRMFDAEFINLGFSGNGKGEPEVARLLASIEDPIAYALDYEANVSPEQLRETLVPFIEILREKHEDVPIVVISRIPAARFVFSKAMRDEWNDDREFQRQTVAELKASGDKNITFVDGSKLLGDDFDECTVDGSHPTDLGFYRMAQNLKDVVGRIILARNMQRLAALGGTELKAEYIPRR